jgi:YfiR/HmsC-like
MRPTRRDVRAARAEILYGWLLVLLFSMAAAGAEPLAEYRVKAVFLFNFAEFVEWPPQAFRGPEAPFVIGILGNDPFGSELDTVVKGETVGQRHLLIERYRTVGELQNCNILYIGRSEIEHLPQILAAVRSHSILTVSDADEADQSGVMIRLLTQRNRIRMQIDVGAARRANLTISSKLLRPAEIVDAGAG